MELTKSKLAQEANCSRSSLYYKKKQPTKDWLLKIKIEKALHDHPGYGHKSLADHLKIGKDKILRVMKIFGLKPYRRRGKRRWKKAGKPQIVFPNLLQEEKVFPSRPNHVWASDFTEFQWRGKKVYIATILDLFTREIVGFSVMLSHSTFLIANALLMALWQRPPPEILHSDQGSEYTSQGYVDLVQLFGIKISMSHVASPWENGYQESFYSHYKIDFGDPNRFESLGELIYAVYQSIHYYNRDRIHSSLKMSPRNYLNHYLAVQKVS